MHTRRSRLPHQRRTKIGNAPQTTVALTSQGRDALSVYTRALRDLLGHL
jgi:hypothetical protein